MISESELARAGLNADRLSDPVMNQQPDSLIDFEGTEDGSDGEADEVEETHEEPDRSIA